MITTLLMVLATIGLLACLIAVLLAAQWVYRYTMRPGVPAEVKAAQRAVDATTDAIWREHEMYGRGSRDGQAQHRR